MRDPLIAHLSPTERASLAARNDWWWHWELETQAQQAMLHGDRVRSVELINQARRMWALCCSFGHDFNSFENLERRWRQRTRRGQTCNACGIAEAVATKNR